MSDEDNIEEVGSEPTEEGAGEGAEEGAGEGAEEGAGEGAEEGAGEGAEEGAGEDAEEGAEEGAGEDAEEGAEEGDISEEEPPEERALSEDEPPEAAKASEPPGEQERPLSDLVVVCGPGILTVDPSKDPWPKDICLYVLEDVMKAPLPENAECLAAEALLRMSGLNFELLPKYNVEAMSPSGRAPLLKCGPLLAAELDGIVQVLTCKGVLPGKPADDCGRLRALRSLLCRALTAAELRVCWQHSDTRRQLTEPQLASKYPWPLGIFIGYQQKVRAMERLYAIDAAGGEAVSFSLDGLYEEVDRACEALSEQLGDCDYFGGGKPSELDALAYGHLYLLLTVHVPVGQEPLAAIVHKYPNLVNLVSRIDSNVFSRSTDLSQVVKGVESPPTQDQPSEEEPSEEETRAGVPTGDEPSEEEPSEEEPSEAETRADEPTGDEPPEDEPTGDEPPEDEPTGEEPPEEEAPVTEEEEQVTSEEEGE